MKSPSNSEGRSSATFEEVCKLEKGEEGGGNWLLLCSDSRGERREGVQKRD